MANRKDNPKMTACTEWEMQLAEALDGVLAPEKQLSFHAHKTTCAACSELYEQARRGQEWLGFLSEEPQVPEGLLERILMTTGPGATQFNAMTPALAGGDNSDAAGLATARIYGPGNTIRAPAL